VGNYRVPTFTQRTTRWGPIIDARDGPVHARGVAAAAPGLYFLGLPWLSRMNSSFLSGVGDDAARLADLIALRSERDLLRPIST
jgi:hypothetical protein